MIFQHYTADDFLRYQAVLDKSISEESVNELLSLIDINLYIEDFKWVAKDRYLSIQTRKPGHHVITLGTYKEMERLRTIRQWLCSNAFPIMCNLDILREDYPQLHMLSDTLAILFVYANTCPPVDILRNLTFTEYDDPISLFGKGFAEYGVAAHFDSENVCFSRVEYLVKRGAETLES